MGGTGVVDRFLAVFSSYIDSGFGLLSSEVAFIATTLIVIDVTLAALFWTWGAQDDIIARLVRKTLFVGVFAYVIGNWGALANVVFESFAGLGLKASGAGLGAADLLKPGRVAQVGIDAARPLLDAMAATRAAGGATMAYATGSAGKTGGAAVAGGMAGIGRAAGGAAMSPLRKASDAGRGNFRDGARAAVGNMGGRIIPAPGTAADASAGGEDRGPPAWAASMKQRQTLSQSASLVAHTVRAGDGHGAGTSIDTREKD